MPLLLDVQAFDSPDNLDLDSLLGLFAEHSLPIGTLRHHDEQWQAAARAHHLAFCSDNANGEEHKRLPENTQHETPNTPPAPTVRKTLVVEKPIRTGQQVYAENADLIVLGLVNEGAEVIADGHIHVYAPLRGRALAGAGGDQTARIFAQSMQAELVSIAGRTCTARPCRFTCKKSGWPSPPSARLFESSPHLLGYTQIQTAANHFQVARQAQ